MTPLQTPNLLLILLIPLFAGLCQASEWSEVTTPSSGETQSIGQTSNGCIAGAKPLAQEGQGYVVMHLERNRYYGHPNLIRTITHLGKQVQKQGLGLMQVGDLGQPRGGPMAFGHRSHQTGIDVDIWFNLDRALLASADDLRSNLHAPSMLSSGNRGINRMLWGDEQVKLLELAAKEPEVDRIFVNAYIKQELCERVDADREWLRKIRPWYYHDDHFHMRLKCPADSPACDSQDPIPEGEGCDEASIGWWLQQHPPSHPKPPPPHPVLPAECRSVISE